jgi:hypothetical protein
MIKAKSGSGRQLLFCLVFAVAMTVTLVVVDSRRSAERAKKLSRPALTAINFVRNNLVRDYDLRDVRDTLVNGDGSLAEELIKAGLTK